MVYAFAAKLQHPLFSIAGRRFAMKLGYWAGLALFGLLDLAQASELSDRTAAAGNDLSAAVKDAAAILGTSVPGVSLSIAAEEKKRLTEDSRKVNNLLADFDKSKRQELAPVDDRLAKWTTSVGNWKAAADRFNTNCVGRSVPESQFQAVNERCRLENQQLEIAQSRLKTDKETLDRDRGKIESKYDPNKGQIKDFKDRLAANAAKIGQIDAVVRRIELHRAKFVEACRLAVARNDLEALKHCSNVNWDGADPGASIFKNMGTGTPVFTR
jgi:hypothetical protein